MKYEIKGDNLPVVICRLQDQESVITETGAMSWRTENIAMDTKAGSIGSVFSRLLSSESMFQNRYTSRGEGEIAFASRFPGSILPVEITPEHPVMVQKGGFLVSTEGVALSVYLQKKLGVGFFGGEGFIMQKLSGSGTCFVEIDGSAIEYVLAPGERKVVNTGHLAMMDGSCQIDIEAVKGMKNIFLGGYGVFNTIITGPGRIILQSMPIRNTAMMLYSFMPQATSSSS